MTVFNTTNPFAPKKPAPQPASQRPSKKTAARDQLRRAIAKGLVKRKPERAKIAIGNRFLAPRDDDIGSAS